MGEIFLSCDRIQSFLYLERWNVAEKKNDCNLECYVIYELHTFYLSVIKYITTFQPC